MTKSELRTALAEAEKLRDEWCAEYALVRDELWALRAKLKKALKRVAK